MSITAKRRKWRVVRTLCFMLAVCTTGNGLHAQVRKFKKHEVIAIDGGVFIEILMCRGEGANEECDVIYYTERRQTGKRLWKSAEIIRLEERAAKQARDEKTANAVATAKAPAKPVVSKAPIKVVTTTPPVKKGQPISKETTKKPPQKEKPQQKPAPKNTNVVIGESKPKALPNDSSIAYTPMDTGAQIDVTDSSSVERAALVKASKKLSVFLDCRLGCDLNYIKTDITVVDFLLNKNAADVHILLNEQPTGGGGSSVQNIFYGQNQFKSLRDTITTFIGPNATDFEKRAAMIRALKQGLVLYLSKTNYAQYLDIDMNLAKQATKGKIEETKDSWKYWVFIIGADGTFNSDQVYKSLQTSTNVSANKTTEKIKIGLEGSSNYNKSLYTYVDTSGTTEYEVINRDYLVNHSLVVSLGQHWGVGYRANFSNNTFSNNKSRLYGRLAVEYSLFPYKDLNTRSITLTYGADVRSNQYYDTTIYFKTREVLYGHSVQANMAFNQKWGTFSSSLEYSAYLHNTALNNLAATINFNIRVTGGLSFYVYMQGARVRNQVYLVKGNASEQDVLTRRRQLASEYNFYSGVGLNFRFGSKLNNFVNSRLINL